MLTSLNCDPLDLFVCDPDTYARDVNKKVEIRAPFGVVVLSRVCVCVCVCVCVVCVCACMRLRERERERDRETERQTDRDSALATCFFNKLDERTHAHTHTHARTHAHTHTHTKQKQAMMTFFLIFFNKTFFESLFFLQEITNVQTCHYCTQLTDCIASGSENDIAHT